MPPVRKNPQPSVDDQRAQLTREKIVRAALDLVDHEGLSALSMRRLGSVLGVDPMAAYHYIPNKEALLDAIVEAVMSEIDLTADNPSASTEDRLVWAARAYRDALLDHVNALPIVLSRGPVTPGAMRPVEFLIGILRQAGLSPTQAMAGMNAIAATVRGLVSMVADVGEQPPTQNELNAMKAAFPSGEFPYLREAVECGPDFIEADFEFGIRSLSRGLVAMSKTGTGAN